MKNKIFTLMVLVLAVFFTACENRSTESSSLGSSDPIFSLTELSVDVKDENGTIIDQKNVEINFDPIYQNYSPDLAKHLVSNFEASDEIDFDVYFRQDVNTSDRYYYHYKDISTHLSIRDVSNKYSIYANHNLYKKDYEDSNITYSLNISDFTFEDITLKMDSEITTNTYLYVAADDNYYKINNWKVDENNSIIIEEISIYLPRLENNEYSIVVNDYLYKVYFDDLKDKIIKNKVKIIHEENGTILLENYQTDSQNRTLYFKEDGYNTYYFHSNNEPAYNGNSHAGYKLITRPGDTIVIPEGSHYYTNDEFTFKQYLSDNNITSWKFPENYLD